MIESFDAGYQDGEHEKFKNYKFDVNEFDRLVATAVNSVQSNLDYTKFLKSQFESHDEL